MTVKRIISAALLGLSVTLLSSCMTLLTNHGYTLKKGQLDLGVDGGYLTYPSSSWSLYALRPKLVYGVTDTISLGVTGAYYVTGNTSYYTARITSLYGFEYPNSTLTLGADLDYFTGLVVNGDTSAQSYSLLAPSVSIAYAFTKSDLRPFVGARTDFLLIDWYGGLDWKLGSFKPSVLVSFITPAFSVASSSSTTIFAIEPGIAYEF